jgi:RHS repeat-associated protein
MPVSPRETVLCRYHYDALDRLDNSAPSAMDILQLFYCKARLATEVQGSVRNSIFQHENQLLAQQRHENARIDSSLLATDQQRSVLNALGATGSQPAAYTPYGHRTPENSLLSLLGFNGERRDPFTGHYPLGNGYRQFNPVLMRFNSPDRLSPFGKGGLNAYAYCVGDPVNRSDPTGHFPILNFVIGVSSAISIGTVVAFSQVEDDVARQVLLGITIAAGTVAVLGTGMKAGLSMTPRSQRSNAFMNRRPSDLSLSSLPGRRRLSDPPPTYEESVSTTPLNEPPPPPYSSVVNSIDEVPAPQPSSPNPSLTRSASNESLSPSTSSIDQSARRIRDSI